MRVCAEYVSRKANMFDFSIYPVLMLKVQQYLSQTISPQNVVFAVKFILSVMIADEPHAISLAKRQVLWVGLRSIAVG